MERAVFDRMAAHDGQHWWYTARRRILHDVIVREISLPARPHILEVGCGTGHNFDMLRQFGELDALEIDDPAREIAQIRLGREVGTAPLPALPGVPDAHYDLVALLDVLEHVEDDEGALRGIARKLAPGGRVLITVPANPWMWSAHDTVHHHHRRYTQGTLSAVAARAGFAVQTLSHFNSLLFPLAAALRIAGKAAGKTSSDDAMPGPVLNGLFDTVFGLERHLVGRVPMPVGVSLLAILRVDPEQNAVAASPDRA